MSAADDYAAAKAWLAKPLPAYVSYTARSHVKFDEIVRNKTSDVVVRTRDGSIVKGNVPESAPNYVHVGTGHDNGMEPVKHPAFRSACYAATSARRQRVDGRNLEALALRDTCETGKGQQNFSLLYVDPRTHEPIVAVGNQDDAHVTVRLEQRFTRVRDNVLPSSLYVRIHGTGMMFWLDVLVHQRYEDYRFSNTPL